MWLRPLGLQCQWAMLQVSTPTAVPNASDAGDATIELANVAFTVFTNSYEILTSVTPQAGTWSSSPFAIPVLTRDPGLTQHCLKNSCLWCIDIGRNVWPMNGCAQMASADGLCTSPAVPQLLQTLQHQLLCRREGHVAVSVVSVNILVVCNSSKHPRRSRVVQHIHMLLG